MNKKLEVKLGYKNIETLTISYNKEAIVDGLKKSGGKILGEFSIDDALENAWIDGAKSATKAISMALNIWFDEEEEDE